MPWTPDSMSSAPCRRPRWRRRASPWPSLRGRHSACLRSPMPARTGRERGGAGDVAVVAEQSATCGQVAAGRCAPGGRSAGSRRPAITRRERGMKQAVRCGDRHRSAGRIASAVPDGQSRPTTKASGGRASSARTTGARLVSRSNRVGIDAVQHDGRSERAVGPVRISSSRISPETAITRRNFDRSHLSAG